ncbi:hypothetical protein WI73_24595 [Burkholderia ubonensis]|uniref:hypothetical protein n=1 Tax=Burkholderia ubonensis TaxID=101571 RepID=UPI000758270D|nr:hypothetical protein [Burkholderia ubonensis]KVC62810.1 hypothetical protein WI73_24595 [Burkholderia ubonensis]
MSRVFIIGLPTQLRRRVEAAAERANHELTSALAGVGERGSLRLVPIPEQAIHDLKAYYNTLESIEEAFVIVLPYAKLPKDLNEELDTLKDFGGTVYRVREGLDGWLHYRPRTSPDQAFLDSIFQKLTGILCPDNDAAPSAYFQALAGRNRQIIIPEGSLDECDDVAPLRHKFLKRVADALEQYVTNGGSGGRIDAFFGRVGIEHAQTGGINASLRIYRGALCVHQQTTNTHLKQGDNTTRISAARVYYQSFSIGGVLYVAVLYAGPHPDADVSRVAHFE